jgi:hypothetical protein
VSYFARQVHSAGQEKVDLHFGVRSPGKPGFGERGAHWDDGTVFGSPRPNTVAASAKCDSRDPPSNARAIQISVIRLHGGPERRLAHAARCGVADRAW